MITREGKDLPSDLLAQVEEDLLCPGVLAVARWNVCVVCTRSDSNCEWSGEDLGVARKGVSDMKDDMVSRWMGEHGENGSLAVIRNGVDEAVILSEIGMRVRHAVYRAEDEIVGMFRAEAMVEVFDVGVASW